MLHCVVLCCVVGTSAQFHRGNKWWSVLPSEKWPQSAEFQQEVVAKMDPIYGDRRHTLVIIGVNLDKSAVLSAFESCMMSREDMVAEGEKLILDPSSMEQEPDNDQRHTKLVPDWFGLLQ